MLSQQDMEDFMEIDTALVERDEDAAKLLGPFPHSGQAVATRRHRPTRVRRRPPTGTGHFHDDLVVLTVQA